MTRNPSFDDEPPESDAEWLPPPPIIPGINDVPEELWTWSPEWEMWHDELDKENEA